MHFSEFWLKIRKIVKNAFFVNFGSKFENVKGKFEKSKGVSPCILVNFGSKFETS